MYLKETLKNIIHKIPAFFSGFILGILLTGAFFLFKINEYLIQIKETLYPKITVVEKKSEIEQNSVKTKKYKKNQDKPGDSDSKHNNIISEDTGIVNEKTSVIEEKIISEKKIQIIHIDIPADTSFSNLAEAPSFLKDNEIKIIFKKTPFNSKGYYFEDNNIVLYGLEDIPYINLYAYKNELYLKYDKKVFKLPFTTHFQSLIKVDDETLLAKMN